MESEIQQRLEVRDKQDWAQYLAGLTQENIQWQPMWQ